MYQLTKQDVKALREAGKVAIDYRREGFDHGKTGQIRAIKEETLVFGNSAERSQATHVVAVPTKLRGRDRDKVGTCYAINLFGDYPEWQGIAWALRPGDCIEIEWRRDNNNGYVDDSTYKDGQKLHKDECWINVKRERGNHFFRYYFDSSVCIDNTARMIRTW